MKKIFLATILFAAFSFGAWSQRPPAQTQTAMTKALNPTAPASSATSITLASGALAHTGVVSAAHNLPVCMTQGGCPGMAVSYTVPGIVFLDRWLLQDTLNGRINELNNDYQTFYAQNPNAPILNYIDGEIARIQGFLDGLRYACQPVDFQGYHTTVNADVIFHDPVSGTAHLFQADLDGKIPLTSISYGLLNGDPVKASFMIYKY